MHSVNEVAKKSLRSESSIHRAKHEEEKEEHMDSLKKRFDATINHNRQRSEELRKRTQSTEEQTERSSTVRKQVVRREQQEEKECAANDRARSE